MINHSINQWDSRFYCAVPISIPFISRASIDKTYFTFHHEGERERRHGDVGSLTIDFCHLIDPELIIKHPPTSLNPQA